MERTKIVEIQGESFKLSIPTMRTPILVESQVASMTRGTAQLLAISPNAEAQKAISNAYKLARLEACATHQIKTSGGLQDDYSYSFFDLDETQQSFIDEVAKSLEEFIDSFRKKSVE